MVACAQLARRGMGMRKEDPTSVIWPCLVTEVSCGGFKDSLGAAC